jgi:hypothetical protein
VEVAGQLAESEGRGEVMGARGAQAWAGRYIHIWEFLLS